MSTIELKKPVPIDVGGHPAKIVWLSPSLGPRQYLSPLLGPMRSLTRKVEKGINAYVEFDLPVRGHAGFAVFVPLTNLSIYQGMTAHDAFVKEVRIRAHNELVNWLATDEGDRDKQQKDHKELDELQDVAQKLADKLGGGS